MRGGAIPGSGYYTLADHIRVFSHTSGRSVAAGRGSRLGGVSRSGRAG
jgi:hypothetical protein